MISSLIVAPIFDDSSSSGDVNRSSKCPQFQKFQLDELAFWSKLSLQNGVDLT
jgi:hypothetical protein